MKPHRQTRHSKRVGSETGVAVGAETHSASLYGDKLETVMQALYSLPPAERKRLLVDAIKRLSEE